MKVFLGGTCNESKWRDKLIPLLKCEYFNPVVKNWTEEAQQLEIQSRINSDFVVYVITPKMTGVYSIAEATYDACNTPNRVIFCVLNEDDNNEFTEHQLKSLEMTKSLIKSVGARVYDDLYDIANFLNNYIKYYNL